MPHHPSTLRHTLVHLDAANKATGRWTPQGCWCWMRIVKSTCSDASPQVGAFANAYKHGTTGFDVSGSTSMSRAANGAAVNVLYVCMQVCLYVCVCVCFSMNKPDPKQQWGQQTRHEVTAIIRPPHRQWLHPMAYHYHDHSFESKLQSQQQKHTALSIRVRPLSTLQRDGCSWLLTQPSDVTE